MIQERLKTIRKAKKWSQQKLANESGIQQALIGKYETGDLVPQIKNLTKISKALSVPIEYFTETNLELVRKNENFDKKEYSDKLQRALEFQIEECRTVLGVLDTIIKLYDIKSSEKNHRGHLEKLKMDVNSII